MADLSFGILKVVLSAVIISFTSWLAGKKPGLAGLVMALPLSSLMALLFAQVEHQDTQKSVEFARSIFVALPLSLTFFVPFLFADKLRVTLHLDFWGLYLMGIVLLILSYSVHRLVVR